MPTLSGRIDGPAHEAWHALARRHGSSVQVLLQFIGDHIDVVLDEKRLADLLNAARDETHDRRRHGGPKRRD